MRRDGTSTNSGLFRRNMAEITSLDTRKVRILQAIVHDYVSTTKPVASDRLLEVCQLGCKSATVRNEMAEMSDMGYLVQPHTSSGRIPTDRGYRYYVDQLMQSNDALTQDETSRVRQQYIEAQSEIEEIMMQTCRLLSEMTSFTSVATDPDPETTTIRKVYLTEASSRHALLVILLSTGQVEHRLVELEAAPSDIVLVQLSNYLNSIYANIEVEQAGQFEQREVPQELNELALSLHKLMSIVKQTVIAFSGRRIYLEGTSHLLRQPEFQDVQRLENLLSVLEERKALYQTLSRSIFSGRMTILIGAENSIEQMQDCTFISSTYRIGLRTAGFLGVIGPTRMNYDRTVATVGLMAHNLSSLLTQLSLA